MVTLNLWLESYLLSKRKYTNLQAGVHTFQIRSTKPCFNLSQAFLYPGRVALNHHTSLAAEGKHPPLFTPAPHFSTLTQHVMTVVSTQVRMRHIVCSHQSANFNSSSSSFSSHVATFLGRFTGSKFLPISIRGVGFPTHCTRYGLCECILLSKTNCSFFLNMYSASYLWTYELGFMT